MIKSSFHILSLLVLVSCASTKLTENEGFLSISSSKEKIYILSVLPPNSEKYSNDLSALLVGHSEVEKHQFSAFTSYHSKLNDDAEDGFAYIDSLPNWGSKRFPILLQSAEVDSTKLNFQFSMDRNSIDFSVGLEELKNSCRIEYKRQKEFNTKVIGTAFQLARIEPLQVNFKVLEERKINQPSILFLHTIEKPELLFGSKLHYYWIDFQFFNHQEAFSVFLSKDEGGKVEVIYGTYPKENYQEIRINDLSLASDETTFIEFIGANSNENLQLTVIRNSIESTKKTIVIAVQIMKGGTRKGNGIAYQL